MRIKTSFKLAFGAALLSIGIAGTWVYLFTQVPKPNREVRDIAIEPQATPPVIEIEPRAWQPVDIPSRLPPKLGELLKESGPRGIQELSMPPETADAITQILLDQEYAHLWHDLVFSLYFTEREIANEIAHNIIRIPIDLNEGKSEKAILPLFGVRTLAVAALGYLGSRNDNLLRSIFINETQAQRFLDIWLDGRQLDDFPALLSLQAAAARGLVYTRRKKNVALIRGEFEKVKPVAEQHKRAGVSPGKMYYKVMDSLPHGPRYYAQLADVISRDVYISERGLKYYISTAAQDFYDCSPDEWIAGYQLYEETFTFE